MDWPLHYQRCHYVCVNFDKRELLNIATKGEAYMAIVMPARINPTTPIRKSPCIVY